MVPENEAVTETMTETIFAHRGCAAQYPENTPLAIREAAPHVDAFEIDVRRCGSGEIVVFHDAELERVTGANGRVDETSLSELRDLEIFDSGEPVPTLAELLEVVPDTHAVNVELKETGIADTVLDVCSASSSPILYSSFQEAALGEVRSADETAQLAVLVHEDPDRAVREAVELGATAVHPSVALCAETNVVTAAHERGFEVNAWTATTRDDVRTLRAAGVDGIITDRWDVV